MKLIALLCIIGFAAATVPTWEWQVGKEHVFEYSGRILSGIPELSSHYAGIGIKCEVALQVKSMDDLRLTLRDVKFSHVNGRIDESSGYTYTENNWRNIVLPAFTPAPEEVKKLLSLPITFSVKEGEIRNVVVSQMEQQWSLNFKKALVVLFQTKMEKSTLDLEMNTINKEAYESKNYWKVIEETVEGVCEVIYQINELPEYFVNENPEVYPKAEHCPTGGSAKYYEITKTKDIGSCRRSSIYAFLKPAMTNGCNSQQCLSKLFGAATSVTRYYACGTRSQLVLQYLENEGELNQQVFGLKSEPVVTGTKQVFRLKSVRPIAQEIPKPSQPRTLKSVSYEYVPNVESVRSQIGLVPKIPQSELKNGHIYKYLPRHFLPTPTSEETKQKLSPEKVMSEIKSLFQKIVRDLMTPEDLHSKEVPMKLIQVVRACTLLKSEELKTVYTQLKGQFTNEQEKAIFQNLFFDAVTVSGTTPAVLFLKEMIASKEMTTVQATTAFMLLPHHIITPTIEVFSSLFELINSEVIRGSPVVYNTAVMSFSNLVQKACLSNSRKIIYPINIFGEFCDPQSEIVTEKWIPFLTHELRNAENEDRRNLIILALGALSHKDVIPTLLPVIQGSGPIHRPESVLRSEMEYRNVSRFLSIYALTNSGRYHPELVLPVLFTVYSNPAENTEVRIAAFNTLMNLNPPMVYLQKVATLTWYEKDTEVLKAVTSYVYALSVQERITPSEPAYSHTSLIDKCRLVFPLMKPALHKQSIPSSGTVFTTEYLRELQMGYKGVTSWVSNYKSIIPSHIYSRVEYLMGNYHFKPFEVAFKLQGAENIYNNLNELLYPKAMSLISLPKMSDEEMNKILNGLPAELRTKIAPLSHENKQKILSLPQSLIERFCEFTSELRQKVVVELNHVEIRKLLSIPQKQERIRVLNLPEAERRETLKSLPIGGRYTTESRQQAINEELYSQSSVEGMTASGLAHFEKQFGEIKDQLHKEWAKVIDQLKIESRENGPLTALAYLNIMDDMTLFGSISDISSDIIHEKIAPLLLNPGQYKTKVCGKTPFSFQRFLNIAPMEFLLPTDMGFPMIIEGHMPVTLSVVGHIEIDCQTRIPSVALDTKVVSTNNMHVKVGTFCPFTKQWVVSGFRQERIINIPVRTEVNVEPLASKLKVVMTPVKTSKPIDIIYSSFMPFTSAQSYYSFAPMTPASSMKPIISTSPVRKMEVPFGSVLGLRMKAVVETENRYLDTSYVMNLIKMFNYNPMNTIRFMFTPSITEQGRPTLRRHELRLQFDPSTSETQKIETTLTVGVATKSMEEVPKYHHIQIKSMEEIQSEQSILKKLSPYKIVSQEMSGTPSVHPTQQELLKKVMLQKLNLKSGAGVIVNFSTVLKGSQERSFEYRAVVGAGTDNSMKQKWDIELQTGPSSTPGGKICVTGSVETPSIPTWDIDMLRKTDIHYQVLNTIGFGQNCQQSMVKMTGDYKVSPRQQRWAKESPVARECDKLIQRRVPGALSSFECDETRIIASSVDEVSYKIDYVNIPAIVSRYEGKFSSYMKALFWPYLQHQETSAPEGSSSQRNWHVVIGYTIQPMTNTMDVNVVRPEERYSLRHIPFTSRFSQSLLVPRFTPLFAGAESVRPGVAQFLGHDSSVCRVERDHLITFDNRSMPMKLDNCFHLVSGDCSTSYRFGVLVRSVGHSSETKEVKVYLNKTEVIMTPASSYSRDSRSVRIVVNGTEVTLERETRKVVRDSSRNVVFELYKTKDNVIRFRAPAYYVELRFDGERLEIEPSLMMKNRLCGICGNFNNQRIAEISGPQKCVYSSPELKVAAYRIPTSQCPALETPLKQRLEMETKRCAKYTEFPTEVYQSFMALVGKCSRHEHMVLERVNEVCFSRVPVTQCGAQCSPKPRQLVSKKISFTCMNNGRIADLYREKAVQGQELPELKQKPETFATSILVPQSCVSVMGPHGRY